MAAARRGLLPLATPHQDLAPVAVDILHAKRQPLVEPYSGAVHESSHQPHHPLHRIEEAAHLFGREHDWETPRRLRARHRVEIV
jgi:hypothetical protein